MQRDPVRYSTLRKEPAYRPASGENLNSFYEKITSPVAIVGFLLAFSVFFNKQSLALHLGAAFDGARNSWDYLALLLLSLVAGLRLIQSVYLARRDYAHLETRPFDIVAFFFVVLFTSGAFIRLAEVHFTATLAVYSLAALIGAVNFLDLLLRRIPRNDPHFDYPVERWIQLVNAATFTAVGILLGLVAIRIRATGGQDTGFYWATGCSVLLLTFNMIHSAHLTYLPKFLLSNQSDSPGSLAEEIARELGHLPSLRRDHVAAFADSLAGEKFQLIRTVRAGRADAGHLSTLLVEHFHHVYSYIFQGADRHRLRRCLRPLITSVGGFGSLGYMSFYWILNEAGERVGVFKIDTSHSNWLYTVLEFLTLPVRLAVSLRTLRLAGIYRRTRAVLATQPPPVERELRLTYLIIDEEHRHRGYGLSALNLLRNATLRHYANDIRCDRMTLFVRERNHEALACFERAGFQRIQSGAEGAPDPLAERSDLGPLVFMELRDE